MGPMRSGLAAPCAGPRRGVAGAALECPPVDQENREVPRRQGVRAIGTRRAIGARERSVQAYRAAGRRGEDQPEKRCVLDATAVPGSTLAPTKRPRGGTGVEHVATCAAAEVAGVRPQGMGHAEAAFLVPGRGRFAAGWTGPGDATGVGLAAT